MKTKIAVILSTLAIALAMMAQSPAPGTTKAAPGADAKACLCCQHANADGKMSCCGKGAECCTKGAACCKEGKCCQGKDGKPCSEMSMSKPTDGGMQCCKDGKCQMDKTKGAGCCGNQCKRPHATA
ncbi:MAG: hypothetical protein ABSD20_08930 [Terriglobales bacterium]|jgi:hypothetical protein